MDLWISDREGRDFLGYNIKLISKTSSQSNMGLEEESRSSLLVGSSQESLDRVIVIDDP